MAKPAPKADEQADPPKQQGDVETTDKGDSQNLANTEGTKEEKKEPSKLEKLKNFGKNIKQAAEDRLTMEGQLKQARISLEKFLDPELEIEQQIPPKLLAGARGMVFLSSIKASFGIGGSAGSGIVLCRLDYGQGWSGPCSLGLLGGQWGFNIGVQKTDFIIVLRDEDAVKTFSGKGQLKLGADASVAAGPVGRDASLAVSVNDKGYTATVSYSQSKGLYAGISLEGQGLAVRKDCNEAYYGKKVAVKDIMAGNIMASDYKNDDYNKIIEILNEYTKDKPSDSAELQKLDDSKQPI